MSTGEIKNLSDGPSPRPSPLRGEGENQIGAKSTICSSHRAVEETRSALNVNPASNGPLSPAGRGLG